MKLAFPDLPAVALPGAMLPLGHSDSAIFHNPLSLFIFQWRLGAKLIQDNLAANTVTFSTLDCGHCAAV